MVQYLIFKKILAIEILILGESSPKFTTVALAGNSKYETLNLKKCPFKTFLRCKIPISVLLRQNLAFKLLFSLR